MSLTLQWFKKIPGSKLTSRRENHDAFTQYVPAANVIKKIIHYKKLK